MRAELSPASSAPESGEIDRQESSRRVSASAARRLFQDDVFERAARRPPVSLG